MSTGPQIGLSPRSEDSGRGWLPVGIAAGFVLLVAALLVFGFERNHRPATVTPVSAPLDPYAGSLAISGLAMSESSNLAGGKVTYVDGRIANKGSQAVTGITVQVLFRDLAKEVSQNETQPLKLIRTRDPYVDLESVSAAPLAPGAERDFRLIFDGVSPDWDGEYPEIRIIHVTTK